MVLAEDSVDLAAVDQRVAEPRPRGFEKLTGAASVYRVQHGRYRIGYLVDDTARTVDVVKVGHRREVDRREP